MKHESLILICGTLLCIIPNQARLLDVSKLFGKSSIFKTTTTQAKFAHNETACIFRFHDFLFLNLKKVNLTDQEHFKGREQCSVEFYNLPKGFIWAKMIQNETEEPIYNLHDK